MESDRFLLRQVSKGDAGVMERVYDLHATIVYSVAIRILHVREGAEEVLQEVFMHLWREPDSFLPLRAGLAGSLILLARDRALDRLWNRSAREHGIPATARGISQRLEGSSSSTQTKTSYSEPQRAFELAFFEGKTVAVIAEELGETPASIKTQIRFALQAGRANTVSAVSADNK